MKRLAIWADKPYRGNALFDPASPLNRDNCLSAYRLLREKLAALGWSCDTHDVLQAAGAVPDAVLFTDMPAKSPDALLAGWAPDAKRYAVLLECAVIKPANWAPGAHDPFDAVFTWDENFVDGKKYFKVNFPNPFPEGKPPGLAGKTGFCVMITANKKSSHPLELYSERERSVRWFEKNHPGELDLYGIGWDRRVFTGPAPVRALNRLPALARLTAPRYPSYRGVIGEKLPVISKYRFSICYENARDILGYITEKIFDCFFAGNIPVYWGAPDITKHVPAECFIDRREFPDHGELYRYMKSLSDAEITSRLEAARDYIAGPKAYPFSDKHFAGTIAGVVSNA